MIENEESLSKDDSNEGKGKGDVCNNDEESNSQTSDFKEDEDDD